MSYTCRLYLNSGFNSVNIPDSPALLQSLTYVDVPTLDILQNRNLPYIDVNISGTSYDVIKNCDYCRLGDDWYYFVDNIIMLNSDTCRLSTYVDAVTSVGGVSGLTILDGITSRVHVSDDTYGKYTETDSYMAPSRTPRLVYDKAGGGGSGQVVVKTTLDLPSMATAQDGITYTDNTTGETVTIPVTKILDKETEYSYGISGETSSLGSESHTALYDVGNTTVQEGLNRVQSIGATGAVSAQVALPSGYIVLTKDSSTGFVTDAKGMDNLDSVALPYEYSGAVNKKVDYSDYTPYGIISCSGDKEEYTPSEIYHDGDSNPSVRYIADPRTDGKPYFRYQYVDGDTTYSGFFTRAVAGLQWKEVPLVYEGAEGSALRALVYSQSRESADLSYTQSYAKSSAKVRTKQTGLAAAGGVLAGAGAIAAGGALGLGLAGSIGGAVTGTLGTAGTLGLVTGAAGTVGTALMQGVNEFTGQADLDRLTTKYETEKAQELTQYMVDTSCYTPTPSFVPDANLARDLLTNGAICYRYEYDDFDVQRIDKILTMYGYKVTKTLETSDFTNRQYFNYIEAGVSIGGQPRWLSNLIARQLSGGVRIWHVLPNVSYYTNNPIVS